MVNAFVSVVIRDLADKFYRRPIFLIFLRAAVFMKEDDKLFKLLRLASSGGIEKIRKKQKEVF